MEGSWDLEVTLYIVSRKGLSDKVTFEQRPKGSQGGSCAVPEESVFHANGMAGTKVLRQTGKTGQIGVAAAERAIAADQPPDRVGAGSR